MIPATQTKALPFLAVLAAVAMALPAIMIAADVEGDPALSVDRISSTEFSFSASEAGTWSFDDGARETGQTVTHEFTVSGLHYVTFSGSSGSGTVTALVTDGEPVTLGTAGSSYRYCPGIVNSVTTDCPGLYYDGRSLCLLGVPTAAGSYTVTVTRTDRSESSFDLVIGDYPLGYFTAKVDHQSVTASLYYQDVKKCNWTVYDSGGQMVRTGQGSTVTFTDLPLGTYKIVNLASVSLSSYGIEERTVTISEKDLADEDDAYAHQLNVLYYIAIAGLILFFAAVILRVI